MQDLRTPKGTMDYDPGQTMTQNVMIKKVVSIFEKHNGVPITTPMFELRPILMNKYGEDSKLIFNLEDQGGDICSLRYDLTVPFSRYLSMNRINKMRKYQIGNVFRRDNPSFKTGRLREFIQADFDICGEDQPMVSDAEVLKIVDEILAEFGQEIGASYIIRVNDRRILSGILYMCGVEEDKQGTICSTIDKSDKVGWKDLEKEFREKGLQDLQIEFIKKFMEKKGSPEDIWNFLNEELARFKINGLFDLNKVNLYKNYEKCNPELHDSSPCSSRSSEMPEASASPAISEFEKSLKELALLFEYLEIYKVKTVTFDLSLARGLEYYTGIIFEASYINQSIGSIIGGGRYDNLCRSISSHSVPCVGFSVGITRILSIFPQVKINSGVFVGSAFGLLLKERMEIIHELWSNQIKAQMMTGKRVNYNEQLNFAKKNNFKIAIFTGENEIKNNKIITVDLSTGNKNEIDRSQLLDYLKNKV